MININGNRSQDYYQTGGTLGVDAQSYVERQADEDLFKNLCDGRFCYVLNGHQVGKSSLVNRVSQKLEEQNRTCVIFYLPSVTDLQLLYQALDSAIVEQTQLDLDSSLQQRIEGESDTGAIFQELIEIVSRHNQDRYIVIFLDEIGNIREPSDFRPSSFFKILKNLSNNFTNVTFCVVGTASKKSLTRGKDVYQATPAIEFFNQGVSIELNGFKRNDVDPLIEGLKEVEAISNKAKTIVYAILDETGGQPFLTQYFCDAIYNGHIRNIPEGQKSETDMRISNIPEGQESKKVQDLIQEAIGKKTANKLHLFPEPLKVHLNEIKNLIFYDDGLSRKRLQLYRNILLSPQKSVDFTENGDEYPSLLLSGIVQKEENKLKLYNPIYEKIFNLQWVNQELKKSRDFKNDILRGFGILAFILVLRVLGLMQPLELFVYDRMLQMRPAEGTDETITVITVDEETLNNENYATTYKGSKTLTDRTVYQLLQKINQYNPKLIGLDIFRNPPIGNKGEALRDYLIQDKQIVSICSILKPDSYPSPTPQLPSQQLGFAEVPSDSRNLRRRQFFYIPQGDDISQEDAQKCDTSYPLSMRLSLRYLELDDYRFSDNREGFARTITYQGKTRYFRYIGVHQGGYQKLPVTDENGFQFLLNYRDNNREQPFNTISVSQLLNNDFDREWILDNIQNRIVLIGYGKDTQKDNHYTPYGEMAGVSLHAHMTSQVINAFKEGRTLLYALSWWKDGIIIFVIGIGIGTLTGLYIHQTEFRLIIYAGIIIIIYGGCFAILQTNGLWLPFIPLIISLVLASEIAVHIDGIAPWVQLKYHQIMNKYNQREHDRGRS